jgi:hypothetical protein
LAQQDFLLPENVLEKPLRESQAWPAGFAWRSGNRLDGEYLLRVWVLAVRRWCWRIGRLTAREIVKRNGRVWLTRSDLDVTLPLREVDIRIRRVGLDIDPGWLPWFGVHGRVVRFHYRDGEAETQKC